MPSKAYARSVAEATAHHAKSKTYSGKFLRPHKPVLVDLVSRLKITSALDYGCGKGSQYTWVDPSDGKTIEQAFGFQVAKFDPAWPPFATEPQGEFDLVICTHVLGSIPLEDLDWVLAKLYGAARKAVYIAEKIGDVGKTALSAPDQRPVGWSPLRWLAKLNSFAEKGAQSGIVTIASFRELVGAESITARWTWAGDGWRGKIGPGA
jgi:hypothetical protein